MLAEAIAVGGRAQKFGKPPGTLGNIVRNASGDIRLGGRGR